MGDPRRTNQLFVNPQVQGAILKRLALFWIGYHLVMFHALFFADYFGLSGNTPPAAQPNLLAYYQHFVHEHAVMIVMGLAAFPVLGWEALKLSYRFVAPMVRFQNSLRSMSAGKSPEKIRLRQGDLLMELQDVFNEYVDKQNLRTPRAAVEPQLDDIASTPLKPNQTQNGHSTHKVPPRDRRSPS